MPRIARTTDGTWHFVGEYACGQFEYPDLIEDATFHESEYDASPASSDTTDTSNKLTGDYQDFCPTCYTVIERWERTRDTRIRDLIALHDTLDDTWEPERHDPRQGALPDCELCGKADSATQYNPTIDHTACPACVSAFNDALTESNATKQATTSESDTSCETDSAGAPEATTPATTTPAGTTGTAATDSSAVETSSSHDCETPDANESQWVNSTLREAMTTGSSADTESTPDTDTGTERSSDSLPGGVSSVEVEMEVESTPANEVPESPQSTDAESEPSLSVLESVRGVGDGTIETLRSNNYDSLEDLQDASMDALEDLPRIGSALAMRIQGVVLREVGENEPVTSLEYVSDVGPTTIAALEDAGYETTADLSCAAPSDLESVSGIGEELSKRLISEAVTSV